jgi:hypothetical protein
MQLWIIRRMCAGRASRLMQPEKPSIGKKAE